MIRAGKVGEISWSATWLVVDVGFSNARKSCAILQADEEEGKELTFNDTADSIIKIARQQPILHLVLEAPLSVAFDKSSNPTKRKIEIEIGRDGKPVVRPWYVGAGCVTMVAAMYLIRRVQDSCPNARIRLFEGFVSFKSSRSADSHLDDVKSLRTVIKNRKTRDFYGPNQLKQDKTDTIRSAFELMNVDLGVPAVIKA